MIRRCAFASTCTGVTTALGLRSLRGAAEADGIPRDPGMFYSGTSEEDGSLVRAPETLPFASGPRRRAEPNSALRLPAPVRPSATACFVSRSVSSANDARYATPSDGGAETRPENAAARYIVKL